METFPTRKDYKNRSIRSKFIMKSKKSLDENARKNALKINKYIYTYINQKYKSQVHTFIRLRIFAKKLIAVREIVVWKQRTLTHRHSHTLFYYMYIDYEILYMFNTENDVYEKLGFFYIKIPNILLYIVVLG